MLTAALTEVGRWGWSNIWVQSGLWFAATSVAGFIRIESRSPSPMLPLELFHVPAFSIMSICVVIINFLFYELIFVFGLFFQIEQQLSPQQTGMVFLPMTVVLMAVNVLAGRLITRIGARRRLVTGLLIAAAGYLLLLPVHIDGSYG